MRSSTRRFWTGIAFLSPNILGVITFTIFPVVFSLTMAFTNWDLTQHNRFKPDAEVEFVGLDNFRDMATEDDAVSTDSRFFRFLGNTLFLMMGIPVSVAGSLAAAMLLSRDLRAGGGRRYAYLLASLGLIASCAILAALGLGVSAMTLLVVGVAAGILVGGAALGQTFYRTLFYTPHFVAGVATFILWKKLYSKETGPVNQALEPVLGGVSSAVQAAPHGSMDALQGASFVLAALLLAWGLGRLRVMWIDGELGAAAAVLPAALLALPVIVAATWSPTADRAIWCFACLGAAAAYQVVRLHRSGERFPAPTTAGFGTALVVASLAMVGQLILLGLGATARALPGMSADGLEAPGWLNNYHFAKPALMVMAFWAAIGSNNMLLYIAALTNVPGELYEAADIDGARPFDRFWHVTWPQLAPTTFFIVVMATIHGLQGGFEMARVMTEGGPAGATTTLSYFVYQEGFETGRLGFASAVAWALFVLVFAVTLFNWKFGGGYAEN